MRDQRAQEEAKEKGKKKEGKEAEAQQVLDLELVKTDPDKLYPIIYYALKRTLKEWEDWMDERPGRRCNQLYMRFWSNHGLQRA